MAQDAKINRIIELTEDLTRKLAAMGETSLVDLFPFCEAYHLNIQNVCSRRSRFIVTHFPSWLPGLRCLAVAKGSLSLLDTY